MKRIVLDCSITLAWFFEDEVSEYSDSILDALSHKKLVAIVPSLWELEVTNVLLSKIRRNLLSFSQAADFLNRLNSLDIRVIAAHPQSNLDVVFPLAHEEKLTSYDASYLQLALTEAIPLASLDQQLCSAAKRVGVKLVKSI